MGGIDLVEPTGRGRPVGSLWNVHLRIIAPIAPNPYRAAGRKAKGFGSKDSPVGRNLSEALQWLKNNKKLDYLPANLPVAVADALKAIRPPRPGG